MDTTKLEPVNVRHGERVCSLYSCLYPCMLYYYLNVFVVLNFPDHCKCHLLSLVTPVHSLHFCIALFSWFNKLNDDDDEDDDKMVSRQHVYIYIYFADIVLPYIHHYTDIWTISREAVRHTWYRVVYMDHQNTLNLTHTHTHTHAPTRLSLYAKPVVGVQLLHKITEPTE